MLQCITQLSFISLTVVLYCNKFIIHFNNISSFTLSKYELFEFVFKYEYSIYTLSYLVNQTFGTALVITSVNHNF